MLGTLLIGPPRPLGRRRDTLLLRSITGGGRGVRREAQSLALRKARRLARRDTGT
jgi:hypothetical protein